ncbi:MAG: hypothetical protein PHD19_05400 [Dechloromonas sp.]|uniref:hypothetical protein n=1 Tax=Azonexus sp. TaxID=1872668 RepID=UPI0035B4A112|nr:hypothetical protein [Dechloromonas sp.]
MEFVRPSSTGNPEASQEAFSVKNALIFKRKTWLSTDLLLSYSLSSFYLRFLLNNDNAGENGKLKLVDRPTGSATMLSTSL